jgi:hypothetical protein
MEPEIREFFKRISISIGLLIFWMAINLVVGIKFGYAFFEGSIHWSNIVFYVWAVASFIGLMYLCFRIWKNPIEHLDD